MNLGNILFITNSADRSGAPLLLLYLAKWLKKQKITNELDICSLNSEALDTEYEKVASNYFILNKISNKNKYYAYTLLKKVFSLNKSYNDIIEKKLALSLSKKNYSFIYANTCVTLEIAIKIKKHSKNNVKIISNIHELPTVIDLTTPNFEKLAAEVDIFIAGSQLVKNCLVKDYKISDKKVKLVYDFTEYKERKEELPRLNDSVFKVGGMGRVDWRKGVDSFLQVARYIKSNYPHLPVHFTWIGKMDREDGLIIKSDIRKAGIEDIIMLQGPTIHYFEKFKELNIFLLTSREDPFPLVAIEAGYNGLPIISFDHASGINEIIKESGGGFIVPYLNIESMAEKIVYYYNNPKQAKADGQKNIKYFSEFDVETAAPKIIAILKSTL